MLVKTVHGGDPDSKPTSILKANLIREFEKRQLDRVEKRATRRDSSQCGAEGSYLYGELRETGTSNCRAAKNEILRRPEVAGSSGISWGKCRTPKRSLPRPLDMEALAAMEAAAPALARDDPGAYVAHLFFSRLGLRNIEIVNARTHWINDGSIGIINRPEEDFFPKGCEGWVPIAPDVLKEVLVFSRCALTGIWSQARIGPNDTRLFIVGIQNGFRSGSRIEQRRATNCAVTLVHGCLTWAPRFSTYAISSGIVTCRRHSSGTPTDSKIADSERSE